MNKVILSGNLTRDPEVRYTQSGKALAKLGIAVNRPYSSGGEGNTPTVDFFNMTAWEKKAEFCGRYLKKGSSVIVEGRIQNNNYEDKNGVKHYTVDINIDNIEFAGRKSDGGGNYAGGGKNDEPEQQPFDDNNTDDVDVPF